MESLAHVTLDMQNPALAVVVYAKQNDRLSRKIVAQLVDGSSTWTVPGTAAGVIRYMKPDGTSGFYDVDENNVSAVIVSGSTATLTLAEQALTIAGDVLMELNFYDTDGSKLTTFTWTLRVQESVLPDTTIVSSSYYNVLTTQVAAAVQAAEEAESLVAAAAGAVRFDTAQTLTNAQQTQARSNIGALDTAGAAAAAPVQSVNGDTGAVTVTVPTSVSQLTNDAGYVDSAGAASAAPVQSVNGSTGAVTVDPLTMTYTPASTDTASTVLAYGQAHPGKIFRWGGYSPATYTPIQISTQWTYTLSNDYSGNVQHAIFEAYDNSHGTLYRCKADGTWTQIANQPDVEQVNGSAVNVATGTATTVQTITLSAGVWAVQFDAQFASNATGYRGIHLATTSGGSTMDRHSTVQVQAANGVTTRLTFTTFFALTSSTTYYLVAEQNSGSTLSVTPGYKYMKFS